MYNFMAALFPIVGGFLAEISWRTPFLVYTFGIPLALVAAKMIPSDIKKTPKENRPPQPKESVLVQVREHILRKSFLYPALLAALSFFITIGIANPYVPVYLANELGIGVSYRGILTSIRFAIAGFSATVMGYFIGRYNNAFLYIITFSITAGGYFFLISTYGSLLSLLPVFLCGIGHGMIVPLSHSLVYDRTSKENQGFIISIYQTLLRVAQATGPITFGVALGLSSLYFLFVLGVVLSGFIVVGLFFQYLFYPKFSAVISPTTTPYLSEE
jgi:MFS family permease